MNDRRSPTRASVAVATRPMWRLLATYELPRYLLMALAVAGLLASARFAIAPPRPVLAIAPRQNMTHRDLAAEGFASLFTRRYLSWSSRDPEAQRLGLAPFVGASMEAGAGLDPPSSGSQLVLWTEVVQERSPEPDEHVYTVAAQTDTAGLIYLSVSVAREADGKLALAGYPALVGAPASTVASLREHLHEVEDPQLTTVITRALRNYLARAQSELAADLTANAHVSLPGLTLVLQSIRSLDWSTAGSTVLAVVQARDARGAQYTLGYELDVIAEAGRWEVSAIQTNPDT